MSEVSKPAIGATDQTLVEAGQLPPWTVGELPKPPRISWSLRGLIGPGLMMAGAAIGGGEWLFGPRVTAIYGGTVMWIATVSIFLQVIYNLEIMRYTLYCGEPILTGFFRLLPGPRVWTVVYLFIDFFGIWPYLASNAAVPLAAVILGHLPGALPTEYISVEETASRTGLTIEAVRETQEHPERFNLPSARPVPEKRSLPEPIASIILQEENQAQWYSYGIFLTCFIPLIFGGKIYNSLERMMVVKIFLVFGYLIFLGVFYVSASTWAEIFAGLFGISKDSTGSWGLHLMPDMKVDWALLGGFAAIAGQGGMTNSQVSSYVRDKGWGMGAQVGAIPSMVGGKNISLSHTGKVFPISVEALARWKGWMRVLYRDQWIIWFVGCLLGVAIPSLVSLEFVRGKPFTGNQIAAATAQGIVQKTGISFYWFATLFCGFIVLVPSHISQVDGIVRRWTDLIWTGNRRVKHLDGHKVNRIYYALLLIYSLWGLLVLKVLKQPDVLTKATTVLMNVALGFSSFHTLAVNMVFLPRELRPGPIKIIGLCLCGVFFLVIAYLALPALLDAVRHFSF